MRRAKLLPELNHTFARALLLGALTIDSGVASAGMVAKQTVTSTYDGKSSGTQQTWTFDGDKFHLSITGAGSETQYVFNGRTLYVCGKLDEALLKGVGADAKLLAAYRQGACQVVPSNFLVRFVLSPQLAAESVDASDGLKLTLGVQDYQLTPPKKATETVAGRTCASMSRSYTLVKSDGQPGSDGEAGVTETLCHDSGLAWSAALAREVAKTVLRQPGGAALMRQLKENQSRLGGFILKADLRQTLTAKGQKARTSTYALNTNSIAEAAVPAGRFKLPEGYRLFAPEGLDLAQLTPVKSPAGKGSKEDSVLDMFQSAFFCAIAGRLGCFAP